MIFSVSRCMAATFSIAGSARFRALFGDEDMVVNLHWIKHNSDHNTLAAFTPAALTSTAARPRRMHAMGRPDNGGHVIRKRSRRLSLLRAASGVVGYVRTWPIDGGPRPPGVGRLLGNIRQCNPRCVIFGCGQGARPRPRDSYVHLFRDGEGVINLDPEVAHRAFNLGVAQQKLDGTQIPGAAVDHCRFGAP